MLDGRIDVQGSLEDLRARGVLEEIAHGENVHAAQQQEVLQAKEGQDPGAEAFDATGKDKKKNPRKLVKDEYREEGSVKWSVYNTYLKAT